MIKKLTFLTTILILFVACGDSGSDTPHPSDKFDRGVMLKHYAENNIIPAFTDFKTKLQDLKLKAKAFTNTPNQSTLKDIRGAWYNAYKVWQHVSKFDIGKAEELQFVNHFNIYPLNATDVENNISNGNYNFNHPNNHDAQGFPALDYLLNGLGDNDDEILEKFITNSNANGYKKYLTDIIVKMNSINNDILNDWNNGYFNTFISSTNNTATSSLNKLVNDFIFYYEKRLRANKIGIPAGVFSTNPLPEKVEAFYNKQISKDLLLESLNAFQDFFEGKSYDGTSNGQSFKTYLEVLNRQELVSEILSQLSIAKTTIKTLDTNFYQQVVTDNTKMTQAYDELQKVVRLLKVDMLQAFNVSVDYIDADGD